MIYIYTNLKKFNTDTSKFYVDIIIHVIIYYFEKILIKKHDKQSK